MATQTELGAGRPPTGSKGYEPTTRLGFFDTVTFATHDSDGLLNMVFGLCLMAARAMSQLPEWEIEMVVATHGSAVLLKIIEGMATATQ